MKTSPSSSVSTRLKCRRITQHYSQVLLLMLLRNLQLQNYDEIEQQQQLTNCIPRVAYEIRKPRGSFDEN